VVRKADLPSRKPVRPWTTKELVSLTFPFRGDEKWEESCIRYHEGTGYAVNELMPLNHALCVITRQNRPGRAWRWARLYLAYGIPIVSHAKTAEIFLANDKDYDKILRLKTHRYVGKAADRFLTRFGTHLTRWQFICLSGSLAAAKLHRHTAARKRNLGEDLGVTPAQRAENTPSRK
jgi:hypothetical protein